MNPIVPATASSSKGASTDERTTDDSNRKDTTSSSDAQEDEDDPFTFRSRKSYPQRVNRPKLNYRDLERGVYDAHELRQSMWAMGGPTFLNKTIRAEKTNVDYSDEDSNDDDDDDNRDMPVDSDEMLDDQKTKPNDDADQKHRRLWCICKKPWDHSRLMLRCDSCANWYHGDCIGMTKEQARVLDMNEDQFVCPPCQGKSASSGMKSGRASDESVLIKRKRIDAVSPSDRKVHDRNGNVTSSKNLTLSEPTKRPKTGIFFHRDSVAEPQIHCIVHGCSNWAKAGWVYCSSACIRRHINDTLQAIQRSKGADNDSPPAREDILLYQNRTKKVLDRKLVPKVEDLCTWINQNPSYEIVKPALRQSILLTANEAKASVQPGVVRSPSLIAPKMPTTPTTPNSMKPKLSWASVTSHTKSVPIKKAPVQLSKQTSNTPSSPSVPNYADIRMKVPQALYDKLITRLEKTGEKPLSNDDIRILADKIEEEMYRVYGKVDNSYKNKFRSLLANISNMNNNFFYKHILSKEVTAKQIVAMKPEDMLPPEEKEKRKDEFEKEVQMIIKAEEQSAEEMARRARTKITRQGVVDNDLILPILKEKEQKVTEAKTADRTESKPVEVSTQNPEAKKTEDNQNTKPVIKTKKPVTSATGQKPVVKPKLKTEMPTLTTDTAATHGRHTFDINCSMCVNPTPPKVPSPKPSSPVLTESIPPPTDSVPVKTADKLPPEPPVRGESRKISTSTFPSVDLDNDYIEPESPTGIDALLYDDDEDLNHMGSHSRSSTSHQYSESPGDNNELTPPPQPSVRDDYNPLAASKPKPETPSMYQPTPIARPPSVSVQWRGIILPPDTRIPCQSARIYGESEYLIPDIPEQLGILGRLRLGDLWDYIRDSLAVRDVIVLALVPADNNDDSAFSRYLETMRTSGRAAVINKRSEPSVIRDMYVLPADTKECPSNVLTALSLPANIDSKQLFLVLIGSGKKTSKAANRSNDSQWPSNLTYKPVSLQEAPSVRDPRLLRNKDPRSGANNASEAASADSTTPSTAQLPSTDSISSTPAKGSTDDLSRLTSESLERIRQATSMDAIHPIVLSTIELLKSSGREDLCIRFTNDLPTVIAEWQAAKATTMNKPSNDNLNEENMEVEEEQEDKLKRQVSESEFNDVDYRFLNQDMDHRMTTDILPNTGQHKDLARKSRFSDLFSAHRDADDRSIKSHPRTDGHQ